MRHSLFPLCIAFLITSPAFGESVPAPAADAAPIAAVAGANYTYQAVPDWGRLWSDVVIGPVHGGVAVSKTGLIYVTTDSPKGICVLNPDGSIAKWIAPDFSGIHALCINEENGEEFIYAAHLKGSQAAKLKLDGTPVLKLPYPPESGAYPEGKGFKPTAIAVAPGGDIFVSDGYGLSLIHKYDATGKYVKTFGGKGRTDGKFMTSHGMAMDLRGEKPLLLICDRENRRLVHFDLDGNFVATIATDLRRPASVSVKGDLAVVAELEARVVVLDKSNKIIATLGDNPDKAQWAKFDIARDLWKPGIFTAPHGADFDAEGNIYVQDWSKLGRVTKYRKVAK
jgi:hypothetical protein